MFFKISTSGLSLRNLSATNCLFKDFTIHSFVSRLICDYTETCTSHVLMPNLIIVSHSCWFALFWKSPNLSLSSYLGAQLVTNTPKTSSHGLQEQPSHGRHGAIIVSSLVSFYACVPVFVLTLSGYLKVKTCYEFSYHFFSFLLYKRCPHQKKVVDVVYYANDMYRRV